VLGQVEGDRTLPAVVANALAPGDLVGSVGEFETDGIRVDPVAFRAERKGALGPRDDDALQGKRLEIGREDGVLVPGRLDVLVFSGVGSGLQPKGIGVFLVAEGDKKTAILEVDDIEPVKELTAPQLEQSCYVSGLDASDRHSKLPLPPNPPNSLSRGQWAGVPFGGTWNSS